MPHAMSAGTRIRYRLAGSGWPLVFHTGFSQFLRRWYLLGCVDALQGDRRLILFDLRGYGESDMPRDTKASAEEHRV